MSRSKSSAEQCSRYNCQPHCGHRIMGSLVGTLQERAEEERKKILLVSVASITHKGHQISVGERRGEKTRKRGFFFGGGVNSWPKN